MKTRANIFDGSAFLLTLRVCFGWRLILGLGVLTASGPDKPHPPALALCKSTLGANNGPQDVDAGYQDRLRSSRCFAGAGDSVADDVFHAHCDRAVVCAHGAATVRRLPIDSSLASPFITFFVMAPVWGSVVNRDATAPYQTTNHGAEAPDCAIWCRFAPSCCGRRGPAIGNSFRRWLMQLTVLNNCCCACVILAFIISELRTAFQDGLPDFRAIHPDRPRIATVLMSTGHDDDAAHDDFAVKLLLFVLVMAGRLSQSLVRSFCNGVTHQIFMNPRIRHRTVEDDDLPCVAYCRAAAGSRDDYRSSVCFRR